MIAFNDEWKIKPVAASFQHERGALRIVHKDWERSEKYGGLWEKECAIVECDDEKEYAERIVKCVNFFRGIPTDEIGRQS